MGIQLASIKLVLKEVCKNVKQCYTLHYFFLKNSYFKISVMFTYSEFIFYEFINILKMSQI